jgi:hypothetical protein
MNWTDLLGRRPQAQRFSDDTHLFTGSVTTSRVKLQRNGFDFIFLDRIYRIDGIFSAFGEEPLRPKAVLSR